MCLIIVGWQLDAAYPLIVAANRDEFHNRPSAACGHWPDDTAIIGGRDLEAGGTWLGLTTGGRFAAVTNVREPGVAKGPRSRGELTADFLRSTASAKDFSASIRPDDYSGFNLLLGDGESLVYLSNRDGAPRVLSPGIYGMSNHRLDTPWPKLVEARNRFTLGVRDLPDDAALFDLLADRRVADDAALPSTGVSLDWERRLSAIFVLSENYGTRASTVLWFDKTGASRIRERSFGADGALTGDFEVQFPGPNSKPRLS